ncbi:branched-chain amino acid ABC transporter permease [Halobacteriales archaeon QS_1_68_17]|nr:MAG: branched-chain amino acid ABC transporter permease [Halobacteriales archaeon QS_1_68_17]
MLWRYSRNDAVIIVGVMAAIYVVYLMAGVLFLGLPLNGIVNTLRRITFLSAVYAMLVLALNLHWGYTGLFNIGVAGFMAVGVYTMAMLSGPADIALGLPLPVGIVGGVVAAALVGAIAALPALRLDADYLAIVTVALSEIIRLSYNSTVFQSSIPRLRLAGITLLPSIPVGTGGGQGIRTPTNPVRALYYKDPGDTSAGLTDLGEFAFGAADGVSVTLIGGQGVQPPVVIALTYVLVLVAFVAGFYWLLIRVGNSPFGRVLKAIREDELVANSLGKDTQRFKIKTFMLGCALMGLAGILWRGSTGFTQPGDYLPIQTFYVFLALIIGGAGSNTGSVVGGIVFATLLFEGPTTLARLIPELLQRLFNTQLGSPPSTFVGAVAPIAQLDLTPLLAYSLRNISTLRFILLGVLIVYMMQNRPDGLFGHRKEVAAGVDLRRPDRDTGAGAATDGSESG